MKCESHDDPERFPQGPNEDLGQCPECWTFLAVLRPENEQFGMHTDDCSLPQRHRSFCAPGGDGHPPVEVVRGFWIGMDEDIRAARERFAS